MYRIATLTCAIMALVVLGLGQSEPDPVIHFSLYAPVQKDPPVHIVGFEHDKSRLRFALANNSEKAVVAVVIVKIDVIPRGCTMEPERGPESFWLVKDTHPGAYRVNLAPHGKGMAVREGIYMVGTPPPSPRYPLMLSQLVENAKSDAAGYMQFQFGVTAVLFDDGSTWPSGVGFFLRRDFDASKVRSPGSPEEDAEYHAVSHPGLLDSSLAEAESGKCTGAAAVASALQPIKDVEFGDEVPQAPETEGDKGLPPHFRFSCSLEVPKAICHIPLRPKPRAHTGAP